MTKEKLIETINGLPESLYSGGLYMRYDANGLWYCGYNGSVFHKSDKDLSTALDMLKDELNKQGYVE